MATKPTPPSGDYALRNVIYAQDGRKDVMSDLEMAQGRNNTGEPETLLGSMTNAHKDNFILNYFNQHIKYLTEMVQYLDSKVG